MKKILKIFLIFSLAIFSCSCEEQRTKTYTDLPEETRDLDDLRTALNFGSANKGVYGTPAEQSMVDHIFSQAKMKRYPQGEYRNEAGKEKQLWAIWYDNYTPEGNTLLEDYKNNRNYIVVLANYAPYNFRNAEIVIKDINGTEYYGFKIALRLE
jgi:hypothetical protein